MKEIGFSSVILQMKKAIRYMNSSSENFGDVYMSQPLEQNSVRVLTFWLFACNHQGMKYSEMAKGNATSAELISIITKFMTSASLPLTGGE